MTETPIDRRIGRTRVALQRALIALILEKGYEATTVEQICSKANVGRSTFYLHYADKGDLKRSGLAHLRGQLDTFANNTPEDGSLFTFSLPMLEHARTHIDLYRALVGGKGADIALGEIRDMLARLVRKDLARMESEPAKDSFSRELTVEYHVGAFMSVLNWWLGKGAKLEPRRVDAVFQNLCINGVT